MKSRKMTFKTFDAGFLVNFLCKVTRKKRQRMKLLGDKKSRCAIPIGHNPENGLEEMVSHTCRLFNGHGKTVSFLLFDLLIV